jgi:hypothetical protein
MAGRLRPTAALTAPSPVIPHLESVADAPLWGIEDILRGDVLSQLCQLGSSAVWSPICRAISVMSLIR